jgi:hypothetical protein
VVSARSEGRRFVIGCAGRKWSAEDPFGALRPTHRVSVSRFAALAGIPERTYWRRLGRYRAGDPVKGPWPSPKVHQVEAVAAKYAADWPAWGHRKIAAMMRVGGHQVSTSTVERALRRRGVVLLPSGFRADRRSWSRLRKRVFRDSPRERNRVRQMGGPKPAPIPRRALSAWSRTW